MRAACGVYFLRGPEAVVVGVAWQQDTPTQSWDAGCQSSPGLCVIRCGWSLTGGSATRRGSAAPVARLALIRGRIGAGRAVPGAGNAWQRDLPYRRVCVV